MRILTAITFLAPFLAMQTTIACADDLSPWFGAADQQPFQLVTAKTIEDPVTNSTSTPPADCNIAGCDKTPETANTADAQAGLSQN